MNPPIPAAQLTLAQAAGFLQRFLPGRDARVWLEQDRRYNPLIPFQVLDGEIFYNESDVVRFVQKIAPGARLRTGTDRRNHPERRTQTTDRRKAGERRRARSAAASGIDRRFALRADRRSDLDRRLRGWVDRRCVLDRRQHIEVGELDLELID